MGFLISPMDIALNNTFVGSLKRRY